MIRKSYSVSGRSSLLTKSALAGLVLALGAGFGSPADAATPTPYLQDSTIVGSGGTLTITDMPVQTSTGSLVYKDVTIQLNAATNGNVTIAPGFPKEQAAIAPILNNFVAGKYAGPPNSCERQVSRHRQWSRRRFRRGDAMVADTVRWIELWDLSAIGHLVYRPDLQQSVGSSAKKGGYKFELL